LSHTDELFLAAANSAVVAYVMVLVEVSAADQSAQLVDIVGSDSGLSRHPNRCFEYLIVTTIDRAKPEDLFSQTYATACRNSQYK
jgi:hypothetical protein